MLKKLIQLCLFASLGLLMSCKITHLNDALSIRIGDSQKKVYEVVEKEEWEAEDIEEFKKFQVNNSEYTYLTTEIVNYIRTTQKEETERKPVTNVSQTSKGTEVSTHYEETTKTVEEHNSDYDLFFFVFKDDKLVYMGYLYEFMTSENSELNKIGEGIKTVFVEPLRYNNDKVW